MIKAVFWCKDHEQYDCDCVDLDFTLYEDKIENDLDNKYQPGKLIMIDLGVDFPDFAEAEMLSRYKSWEIEKVDKGLYKFKAR